MGWLSFTAWLSVNSAAAVAQPFLEVEGQRAETIKFLRTTEGDGARGTGPLVDSPMGRQAGGVLRMLQPDEFKRLTACVQSRTSVPGLNGDPRLSHATWLHIALTRGKAVQYAQVHRYWDGRLMLVVENAGGPKQGFWVDPGRLYDLVGDSSAVFLGDYDWKTKPEVLGKVNDAIYADWGPLHVDRAALTKRFFAGLDTPPPAKIESYRDGFRYRIPKPYDARAPLGMLVWVSPGDDGTPPPQLAELADELGLVLAGANKSGNDRPVADRLQLALSIVSDVAREFHVDPRRVYIAGMSGGGKIATILQAGCPEIFSGCIPIVGTGWRRDVRLADGKAWPRIVGQPAKGSQEVLRSRRIAPITGQEDFNYRPMLAFAAQMKEDGLAVQVFDVPGLGHEMPSAAALREAVVWVDGPWQVLRQQEVSRGRELMKEYRAEYGADQPRSAKARELLQRLTSEAPWTEESWQAVEWLRRAEG